MNMAEFATMDEFVQFMFNVTGTGDFWLGGNALSYMSLWKDQVVPTESWRWISSGRVMDLPNEAWGTDEPNRLIFNELNAYEACTYGNKETSKLKDGPCDSDMLFFCQQVVQGEDILTKNDLANKHLYKQIRPGTIEYVGKTFRSTLPEPMCSTPVLPKKIYYLDTTPVSIMGSTDSGFQYQFLVFSNNQYQINLNFTEILV
jgi:hypothetical protein